MEPGVLKAGNIVPPIFKVETKGAILTLSVSAKKQKTLLNQVYKFYSFHGQGAHCLR